MRDLKTIAILVVLAIIGLIVIGVWFPAEAAEPIRHIDQGETIYVGGTYDIAGVTGWPDEEGEYYIGWCSGGYGCYTKDADYVIHLPGKYKSGTVPSQYRYYIDPAIFSNKTGVWEQYTGEYESAGNTVVFRVALTRPKPDANVTVTPTPTPSPKIPIVPVKNVADYLVAHGDKLTISAAGPAKLWLFGRIDGIYDTSLNVSKNAIMGMESGSYQLLIQQPGKNGIYETSYCETFKEPVQFSVPHPAIVSPWRSVNPVDISGLAPFLVKDKVIAMIKTGDDTYAMYDLVIQDPTIEITRMDEMYISGESVLDVRGYTNVAPDTILTFTLDEDKTNARSLPDHTFKTETKGLLDGNQRWFQVYIPIRWDFMTPGQHTITGRTPLGGDVFADFWVSDIPEGQQKPNASIKYIENRNPFVPTPTPEIITQVVTQVVTQTVLVPVTPSNEQVYAQQLKAQNDINDKNWRTVLTFGGAGLFLIGGIWYTVTVIRRAKKE